MFPVSFLFRLRRQRIQRFLQMLDDAVTSQFPVLREHVLNNLPRVDGKVAEMFILIVSLIKSVAQQCHHAVLQCFLCARFLLNISSERANRRCQQLFDPILYQELQ